MTKVQHYCSSELFRTFKTFITCTYIHIPSSLRVFAVYYYYCYYYYYYYYFIIIIIIITIIIIIIIIFICPVTCNLQPANYTLQGSTLYLDLFQPLVSMKITQLSLIIYVQPHLKVFCIQRNLGNSGKTH